MKKSFVFGFTLFLSISAFAQQPNFEEFVPISGEQNPYEKKAINERPVIKYPFLQEADVKYQKKIHRIIDCRQKMNKILEWPKNPLYQYIYGYAIDGTLKAYNNDSLYSWMTPEHAQTLGSKEYTIQVPNPLGDPDDPFDVIDSTIREKFEAYKIKKYMLLEDWYFDHKHSVFKPRIMAIAPMYMLEFGGVEVGEQPMFWLKMDDLRPLIKNLEVFNSENDASRISYDHFFQFRLFDSYIVKQSNMYDLYIKDYEEFKDDNMAALLKSEEIKNNLFIFEHDLWEY
ncbi:MAG: gliding motility protein GldN [Bacteroidia bacterium]|nr:gliding motility protein GldN [Bacteroidia bacterium]MCO5254732.1 gliding motility protein GldN [Bacteroidota bacterium]